LVPWWPDRRWSACSSVRLRIRRHSHRRPARNRRLMISPLHCWH
jgi:hypothetical protein